MCGGDTGDDICAGDHYGGGGNVTRGVAVGVILQHAYCREIQCEARNSNHKYILQPYFQLR